MGIRRNVARNEADRSAYVQGCVALSQTSTGVTGAQADAWLRDQVPGWQLRGDDQIVLSWWDWFALWHYTAMRLPTAGQAANRAHGGPIFLPWHRLFLLRLEEVLQIVLGDPNFGLPYWDWAADGELPTGDQHRTPLFGEDALGTPRGRVDTGALGGLGVQLSGRFNRTIGQFLEIHAPRPIERAAGLDFSFPGLPTKADVSACLTETRYDNAPWDVNAAGFRNHLEGWTPNPPGMHNRVHVWVGGDMSPATSPNDPLFYLNHCNVDRIWEAKLRSSTLTYLPANATPNAPAGHRSTDPMVSFYGDMLTPEHVIDPTPWYSYDDLNVEA